MKVVEKTEKHVVPLPQDSGYGREGSFRNPDYSTAEVSRLLGVPVDLLYRWGRGYQSNGHRYSQLIIKSEDKWWNWFELLQSAWLWELAPLGRGSGGLSRFLDAVADHFGEVCPIGLERFWSVEERGTLWRLQLESGLEERFWVVVEDDDSELVLSPTALGFFDRLAFDEWGWAPQLVLEEPMEPGDAPIVLNTRKGFGNPIIRYIGVLHLRSYVEGGDSVEDMVDTYGDYCGMTASDVRRAVDFARRRQLSF